jgi:hypothetical protein
MHTLTKNETLAMRCNQQESVCTEQSLVQHRQQLIRRLDEHFRASFTNLHRSVATTEVREREWQ